MQIKSNEQIEEKEIGHQSLVNGLSVECNRDRAADDDILVRNSAATVISNQVI